MDLGCYDGDHCIEAPVVFPKHVRFFVVTWNDMPLRLESSSESRRIDTKSYPSMWLLHPTSDIEELVQKGRFAGLEINDSPFVG